ncbi:thioredoxin family protein [Desulfosporosinus sp. FKA]|uniref:thioredoxin family protein n=1 Tax=Desulfosporosinus sp. FKA TaxID=1969834 RepID=UPI000B49A5BE|nr:thioredoxin family protein [Desulfosporosinus sp. FKA]
MTIESAIYIQSKEQLNQLMEQEKVIFLYFTSQDCKVCHAVFSKLMNLIDPQSIKVANISVNEHVEIAGQLLVFTVPTILIVHEGKEILRESRFIDFQKVERILNFLK